MKSFKRIDFWTQVVVIIAAVLYAFTGGLNFISSYCAVVIVQITSATIHFGCRKKFVEDDHRSYFNWIIFCIAIIGGLCFAFPILILLLYPLLFIFPVIALWYLAICEQELVAARSCDTPDQNTLYEK